MTKIAPRFAKPAAARILTCGKKAGKCVRDKFGQRDQNSEKHSPNRKTHYCCRRIRPTVEPRNKQQQVVEKTCLRYQVAEHDAQKVRKRAREKKEKQRKPACKQRFGKRAPVVIPPAVVERFDESHTRSNTQRCNHKAQDRPPPTLTKFVPQVVKIPFYSTKKAHII